MSKPIKGKYTMVGGDRSAALVGEVRYLQENGRLTSEIRKDGGGAHAGPFVKDGDVYVCDDWEFTPDEPPVKKPREYMILVRFRDGSSKLYGATGTPQTWSTKEAAKKHAAACIKQFRKNFPGITYTVVRKGKVYE